MKRKDTAVSGESGVRGAGGGQRRGEVRRGRGGGGVGREENGKERGREGPRGSGEG